LTAGPLPRPGGAWAWWRRRSGRRPPAWTAPKPGRPAPSGRHQPQRPGGWRPRPTCRPPGRRTGRPRPWTSGRSARPRGVPLKERDARLITVRRGGTLTDEHHRLLADWALLCAEHVLHLFEDHQPGDSRPRKAIDVGRAWIRGEVRMGDAHRAAFRANSAARGMTDPAKFAALSAGQAVAVAHVAAHDLGAAAYAIRAASACVPADGAAQARTKEREWQRAHLPAAIRELVLDDQQRRSAICCTSSTTDPKPVTHPLLAALRAATLARICRRSRFTDRGGGDKAGPIRSSGESDTAPTPPPVAGVGHGSEPPWLIHRIGSTRAVSSASLTRTVVTVVLPANRGPCSGGSARGVGSPAGTWATRDRRCRLVVSWHIRSCRDGEILGRAELSASV
jgi:hypothetical protein